MIATRHPSIDIITARTGELTCTYIHCGCSSVSWQSVQRYTLDAKTTGRASGRLVGDFTCLLVWASQIKAVGPLMYYLSGNTTNQSALHRVRGMCARESVEFSSSASVVQFSGNVVVLRKSGLAILY